MALGPLASIGIDVTGYKITKRQLLQWTDSKISHTVFLYSLGGVFTSQGDGVYKSWQKQFDSTEEFWKFARDFRSSGIMKASG